LWRKEGKKARRDERDAQQKSGRRTLHSLVRSQLCSKLFFLLRSVRSFFFYYTRGKQKKLCFDGVVIVKKNSVFDREKHLTDVFIFFSLRIFFFGV